MKRENRYIVFKKSDVAAGVKSGRITHNDQFQLNALIDLLATVRADQGKDPLSAVVVESDWPEYEHVWELIRLRVENAEIPAETVQSVVDAPAVDSALRAFTDDATNDNAFFLVRAIMEACLPREPKTFDSVKEGLAATKSGDTFKVGKPTFGPGDR